MIPADPAFTCVVRKTAELGAAVEGANGVGAQRAKTHGGDVEERQRIGLAAIGAAHRDVKVVALVRMGDDRVIDPLEVVAVDVLLGAERPLVERALRALVNDRALRPVERRTVGVALQKILADFRPDLFQKEADMGEDGIIAPDAVAGLQEVPDADGARDRAHRRQCDKHQAKGDQRRKNDGSEQACRQRCVSHGTSHAAMSSRAPFQCFGKEYASTRSRRIGAKMIRSLYDSSMSAVARKLSQQKR